MASVTTDRSGKRRVQFVDPFQKQTRRTIYLGKVTLRAAEQVKFRIEQLVASKTMGYALDNDTARWVAELGRGGLADKLARVGLIEPPEQQQRAQLDEYLTAYVERRTDVKPATRVIWRHAINNLTKCFGKQRDMANIDEGDAEDFKLYLIEQGLAPTTVHKRLQVVRMIFRDAVRRNIVSENPFAGVSAIAVQPVERQHFVTREVTDKLIASSDLTWRLIIALSRYGGLRCPSEVLSLRWAAINWPENRITVDSPKTEHRGKGQRTIPLFPELVEVLREAWEAAEPNAEYVVPGDLRKSADSPEGWRNCNLRTQFNRIISREGVSPWPKLFQSMRSSRETELAREHPIHVVTAWMGNTPKVALKHYLQVTDFDFDKGAGLSAEADAQTAQKPTQHLHASSRTETPETTQAQAGPGLMREVAKRCVSVPIVEVAGAGFEPTTSRL
ncbi:tyrosine-type recombinase/integrase [Aeoliella mucimassa]|uniref:Tyrosine recombinase XerC n=1 Tax=Aeoliella mucimassa TaxID=2527972 RepID=A0A518APU4_9BACT|nr:phage integrase SAM-like domain-containing protein [Aeoliella mucimassa]QDU56736.1 Tyrosine recombinase XerC [Aeoliella mucimassa]